MTLLDEIRRDINIALEQIGRTHPEAADYLRRHIVYDDEGQTLMFTGDPEVVRLVPVGP